MDRGYMATQLVGGRKRLTTVVTDMVWHGSVTSLRGSLAIRYKFSTSYSTLGPSIVRRGAIRLAGGTLNQSWLGDGE
jgi:hypothetical protein